MKDVSNDAAVQDWLRAGQTGEAEFKEDKGKTLEAVDFALSRLTPRAADILHMRCGLPPYSKCHTLEEIGEKYKLQRETIRLAWYKALKSIATIAGKGTADALRDVANFKGRSHRKITLAEKQRAKLARTEAQRDALLVAAEVVIEEVEGWHDPVLSIDDLKAAVELTQEDRMPDCST